MYLIKYACELALRIDARMIPIPVPVFVTHGSLRGLHVFTLSAVRSSPNSKSSWSPFCSFKEKIFQTISLDLFSLTLQLPYCKLFIHKHTHGVWGPRLRSAGISEVKSLVRKKLVFGRSYFYSYPSYLSSPPCPLARGLSPSPFSINYIIM